MPKRKRKRIDLIPKVLPRLAIPVGTRFQADVPEWTGPPAVDYHNDPDTLRFLGQRTWPIQDASQATENKGAGRIGKGRSESCLCQDPGSVKCVNRHITQERNKLQIELGRAFQTWNLDKMGEKVSESWTPEDKETFDSLVKKNPLSQNKSFLKPAMEALPSKNRESIVSYYFNSYVHNRIREQTRAGFREIDTDDDEPKEMSTSRNSGKRSPDESDAESASKTNRYLIGHR